MDLGISGKTALVLGASGGLGRAIALALAAEGVNVVAAARGEEGLAQTVARIEAAGGRAKALTWDLADRGVIADRLDRAEAAFGPIDILVNNSGGPPPTPAQGQDPALWQSSFETMVLSLIAITDAVLPGMKARGWGRIITSTSSSVANPMPNMALSNSLRAVLHGWSKTLSKEVGPDGITVNVLVPGRIATDRIAFLDSKRAEREGKAVDAVEAENLKAIPVGRLGEPAEYGAAAAFLASQAAAFITGAVLRVDGGMSPDVY
jgi:3-oxoacyl-[acyl-carrier protein] reductase